MELAAAFRVAPVYAIYDTQLRPEFAATDVICAWLQAGVRVIQYRHKGLFDAPTLEVCHELAKRVADQDGIFIVNDRADITLLVKAQGVHLGQDDLPSSDARKLLREAAIIGRSTHTQDQVIAALSMPIDYVAVGPVFNTSTKQNPEAVVGLELVQYARHATKLPLTAIGGISIDNLASVLQAGADSVATVSGLLAGCKSIEEVRACAREVLERAISARRQAPGGP